MRPETETTVDAPGPLAGRPCTACGQPLAAGDRAVVCPRCRAAHHSACWARNGGCATRGCPQVALTVTRAGPALAGAHRVSGGTARGTALARRAGLAAMALALASAAVGLATWRRGPAPVHAPPTLRVLTWATPEDAARLQALVDAFNRSRPDVRVRLETTPYVAYEPKLVVEIAAGYGPDVFALPPDRVPVFASEGALLDLAPFAGSASPAVRQAFFSGSSGPYRQDDHVWAVPNPVGEAALVVLARTPRPELAWAFLAYLAEAALSPEPSS